MIELLATLFGAALGCVSVIPGVHSAALIAGLLPALGAQGLAGSCFVVAAAGAAMMTQALSKTFQPATAGTLASATPEVKMAYAGSGLVAVDNQNLWMIGGALVSLVLLIPIALTGLLFPDDVKAAIQTVSTWAQLPLMLLFTGTTLSLASNKLSTVLVMLLAAGLGFYSMGRVELAGNPSSLAPLLTGIFVLPTSLAIVMQTGQIKRLPPQRPATAADVDGFEHSWIGHVGGMITAVVAGVGASSAVASFAKTSTEEEYLSLQAAAEGSNNTVAMLLLVLIGAGHSSTAVAVQAMSGTKIDVLTGVLILFAGGIGITVGRKATVLLAPSYARLITAINPRHIAAAVLLLSMGIVVFETGTIGVLVASAAGALGLVARTSMVPNQALLMILTGPVLIQKLGLARELALALGIIH